MNHNAYIALLAATERHTAAHQQHRESFGRYIRHTEADLDAARQELDAASAAYAAVAHLCRAPGCNAEAVRGGHCEPCCAA